jgi:hypothetical protein
MNTDQEGFYEDTLWQLGHIVAEISQLLTFLGNQEVNPSVIQHLKSQVLLHDRVIIEKLGGVEQSIRDVRAMVDRWTVAATVRLQYRPGLF